MKIVSSFQDKYDYADGYSEFPIWKREKSQFNLSEIGVMIFNSKYRATFIGAYRIGDLPIVYLVRIGPKTIQSNNLYDCFKGEKFRARDIQYFVDSVQKSFPIHLDGDKEIVIYHPVEYTTFGGAKKLFWTKYINPPLKGDYFPFIQLDNSEIHMAIHRMVANRIEIANRIPYIDDVTMAKAKGFDKFSFRKDKQ